MSEAIAAKIKKLIAFADSTAHPEEAETFMAKAHELLLAHGISLLGLGRMGDDPVGQSQSFGHNTASDQWRGEVAHALSTYYGCKTLFSAVDKYNKSWFVFGRESARITFELMWPYIDRRVMELARREHKAGNYTDVRMARRKIGNALARRIWVLINERRAQEAAATEAGITPVHAGTGVNALVPVDIITAAMDDAFAERKTSKAAQLKTDGNARNVANEVSLNLQTTAKAGALRIK
jgi:hypothetical protein